MLKADQPTSTSAPDLNRRGILSGGSPTSPHPTTRASLPHGRRQWLIPTDARCWSALAD